MNSYIRIVATHCSLGTWFVSGNISVDTLHKGATKDDDDDDNNNNNGDDDYDDDNNNNNNILMTIYLRKLLIKLTSIVINSTRTKLQIIPRIERLTDLCIWDVECSFNNVSVTEVWWCWNTVSGGCKQHWKKTLVFITSSNALLVLPQHKLTFY